MCVCSGLCLSMISTLSPIHFSASKPDLFFSQNGLNALHLAAKEGHVGLVQELLGRGSSVDSATKVPLLPIEFIS